MTSDVKNTLVILLHMILQDFTSVEMGVLFLSLGLPSASALIYLLEAN